MVAEAANWCLIISTIRSLSLWVVVSFGPMTCHGAAQDCYTDKTYVELSWSIVIRKSSCVINHNRLLSTTRGKLSFLLSAKFGPSPSLSPTPHLSSPLCIQLALLLPPCPLVDWLNWPTTLTRLWRRKDWWSTITNSYGLLVDHMRRCCYGHLPITTINWSPTGRQAPIIPLRVMNVF